MTCKFVHRTEFQITFDRAEVALMMEHSSRHYDDSCRAASLPGGTLWGIKNGEGECWLAFRELDLLCKVMETPRSREAVDLLAELVATLRSRPLSDFFERVARGILAAESAADRETVVAALADFLRDQRLDATGLESIMTEGCEG